MERKNFSFDDLSRIHSHVRNMLLKRGFKATTMDAIAADLGMSKRTLYEIFGSKDKMLRDSLEAEGMIHAQKVRELVNSSKNAMVGLYRAFSYHLQLFSNVSIDFFRDLDRLYSHIRHDYDRTHSHNQKQLQDYMERGVSEGVFRDDIDYQVHIALLEFQMEALKRLEYNFPPNITLPKAIEHINYSFLRAVATPKGLEMLEDAIQSQNTFIEHDSDE